MILTTLPSASAIASGFCFNNFAGCHSKYPFGLFSSAERRPSVSAGSPPATSICIINDVPERGRPDTTVIKKSTSKTKFVPNAELQSYARVKTILLTGHSPEQSSILSLGEPCDQNLLLERSCFRCIPAALLLWSSR